MLIFMAYNVFIFLIDVFGFTCLINAFTLLFFTIKAYKLNQYFFIPTGKLYKFSFKKFSASYEELRK